MNKNYRTKINTLLRTLLACVSILVFNTAIIKAADDDIPERPSPPHLVNNLSKEFPDFLSETETANLENKLVNFSNNTSNQIAIVIIDDLGGYEASDFSFRLGEKWGVGQGKFDNGIVVLVKPTGGAGQRDVFIAIGYGLEGVIPDITAKQVVEKEIIPNFKKGDNYKALDDATNVLMALAKGEFNSDEYAKKSNAIPFPFILIFIIIMVLFSIFRRRSHRSYTIGRGGAHWGGWSGGGYSGGSSGGGGFGGFGGGGFGGGGAGGKW